jgi:hypothetical protein
MFTGLLSFLGGSAFRMIWGEVSAWLTAKQDHEQEVEKMKLQGQLDDAAAQRNIAMLQLQAQLGIKTIEAQTAQIVEKADADAFAQAVKDVGQSTRNDWVDTWNRAVRPYLATLAAVLVTTEIIQHGFILSDWDHEVVGAILGIYLADRSLSARGK